MRLHVPGTHSSGCSRFLRASVFIAVTLATAWPSSALATNRPRWHPGPPWAPLKPGSNEVHQISDLFWVMLIISGIIFAAVTGLLILNIVKFSAKPGAEEPPQVFGNRRVELAWTLIPTFILLVAFIFTVKYVQNINTPEAGASAKPMDVNVIGHQWWWEFRYPPQVLKENRPNPDITIPRVVITANELHLPTDTSLHFHITSNDVIHSFWTPQLQRQVDANPGIDNAVFVKLTNPGSYDGDCYEYCGTAHAWMKYRVIAQTPAQFTAWLQSQLKDAPQPTDASAARGLKIFNNNTCVSCHIVTYPGTPAHGAVGPNLTHLGSRWTVGAGAAPMSKSDLMAWIQNPDTYKPGTHMPGFPLLSQKDLSDLATYLLSLK